MSPPRPPQTVCTQATWACCRARAPTMRTPLWRSRQGWGHPLETPGSCRLAQLACTSGGAAVGAAGRRMHQRTARFTDNVVWCCGPQFALADRKTRDNKLDEAEFAAYFAKVRSRVLAHFCCQGGFTLTCIGVHTCSCPAAACPLLLLVLLLQPTLSCRSLPTPSGDRPQAGGQPGGRGAAGAGPAAPRVCGVCHVWRHAGVGGRRQRAGWGERHGYVIVDVW